MNLLLTIRIHFQKLIHVIQPFARVNICMSRAPLRLVLWDDMALSSILGRLSLLGGSSRPDTYPPHFYSMYMYLLLLIINNQTPRIRRGSYYSRFVTRLHLPFMLRYELAVAVTLCIVMYKCTCYSRVEYLVVGSAFNLIGCTLDLLLVFLA